MIQGYSQQPVGSPAGGDPAAMPGYFPPPYSAAPSPTLPVPPAARSVPTVLGLLNALKRRWVLASFLGLLAALAAAAGFWLAAPTGKHQIKALVEIKPLSSGLDDRATENDSGYSDFKQNQETLIRTRSLLDKVVHDPKVSVLPMIAEAEDPIRLIDDLLTTKWPGPSLMAVIMNGDQPEQLRTIMDVLIAKYIEQSRIDMVTELEKKKKITLANRDKAIRNLNAQLNFISQVNESTNSSPSDQFNADQMLRLNEKIGKAEQFLEELQSQHRKIKAAIATNKELLAKPETLKLKDSILEAALENDGAVAIARGELETARQAYEDIKQKLPDPSKAGAAMAKYTDAVNAAQTRYIATREARKPVIEQQLLTSKKAELEFRLEQDQEKLASLENEIASARNHLGVLNEELKKLNKGQKGLLAHTDLTYLKDGIYKFNEKLQILDELLDSPGRIVKKEDAIVIPNPNIRQKMMFGVAIALVAFMLVITTVAFLEWRSRRVDNVDQVLNELNMRVLGTIPAFPSRASIKAGDADLNQNWRFILNESVNSARTMLLHSAKSQKMQVIMVTSAMQGEGKTSLASQLATSMATAGLRTLILDLDLRNPSMNRLFDLPLTPGVSEVLLHEVDVSDAVQPTSVPNLWVIPAGQCSNRVIASLAQGHPIETLFNRLRGQFEFIVIDTCPVLPVADAMLIGQHVDGVVFSILQDISQLPKVLNASERLAQLNIPLLGAVVNGIKTDVHAYGYNYVKQLPA